MSKDFTIYSEPSTITTKRLAKASSTVLEEGDMATLVNGLATKAVPSSTEIAYVCKPAGVGETDVLVTSTPGVVYSGTGDAAFAAAMRGSEVDLAGTTDLLIDVGSSAKKVLKIEAGDNAGTVGSADGILVTINKPLSI